MPTRYEAVYLPTDHRKPAVWCNSPQRDDVFAFLVNTSPQLAEGRLELRVVEHSLPELAPYCPTPAGNWARYAPLGTNLKPW